MNVWTAVLMVVVAAIAYHERRALYLLVLSAYATVMNWRR